jgi:hypothetical protein
LQDKEAKDLTNTELKEECRRRGLAQSVSKAMGGFFTGAYFFALPGVEK